MPQLYYKMTLNLSMTSEFTQYCRQNTPSVLESLMGIKNCTTGFRRENKFV